jgi:predicted Zn-dependent protease
LSAGSLWLGAAAFYFLRVRRESRQAREDLANKLSGASLHSDEDLARIVEKYPTSKAAAIRYAEWSERRNRWDEAVWRWTAMTRRFPKDPTGYLRCGGALRAAGRFDDADAILFMLQRRFPDHTDVYSALAWVAHGRTDWPEAARRWAAVRERDPLQIAAYIHGAAALRQAGRLDDAARLLDEARRRFPHSQEVKAFIER